MRLGKLWSRIEVNKYEKRLEATCMRWIVVVIFLPTIILLLSGRGGFLIAGYNTASEAEKKKYDEKKLCRVMGGGMTIIMGLIVGLLSFEETLPDWCVDGFAGIVLLVVFGIILLSNTICKVKNPEPVVETKEDAKRRLRIWMGSLTIGAVILFGVGILLTTGQVKATIGDTKIQIQGSYWKDYSVPIASIEKVSYTEEFDPGTRRDGMGSFKLLEGSFKNSELGAYTLYAYKNCHTYVKLHTSTGAIVVNASTPEETRQLYETIEKVVEENK